MQTLVVALLVGTTFCTQGMAETIISISGPSTAAIALTSNAAETASWTQITSFQNVVISAMVSGPALGMAYLTTSIGPGTTLVDQIASTSFSFPSTPGFVLLFSGLALRPDTYFLTLTSNGRVSYEAGTWSCVEQCQGSAASVVTDLGVSRNADRYTFGGGTNAIYPPAGNFILSSRDLIYTVATAPEPGVAGLLGTGLLTATLLRQKRFGINIKTGLAEPESSKFLR